MSLTGRRRNAVFEEAELGIRRHMLPALECDRCAAVVFATVAERILGEPCTTKAGCDGTYRRAPDLDIPPLNERLRDRPRPMRA
jgi:hypothetical protein